MAAPRNSTPPSGGRSWAGAGRHRDRRSDRSRPGAARQLGRAGGLVGRAGAAAHGVHARAQRRLRHAGAAYPAWSDDQIFDKARLMSPPSREDPHRRVDDGDPDRPALRIGMRANWFGLAEERVRTLFGRMSDSEIVSGIPDRRPTTTRRRTPSPRSSSRSTGCIPLVPDDFHLRSVDSPAPSDPLQFLDAARLRSRQVLKRYGATRPALLVRHGPRRGRHPAQPPAVHAAPGAHRGRHVARPRRDRHPAVPGRGVPRYNDFRRLLRLPEVRSFEDLTGNPQTPTSCGGLLLRWRTSI